MGGWIYHLSEMSKRQNGGKWMYFFQGEEHAEEMCRKAVEEGVVTEAKHTDGDSGMAIFYLEADDLEGHKRVIEFFKENGLIRKTKAGKFFNISFKLDEQTRAGEYGKDYKPEIKLSEFMDLETGEWLK